MGPSASRWLAGLVPAVAVGAVMWLEITSSDSMPWALVPSMSALLLLPFLFLYTLAHYGAVPGAVLLVALWCHHLARGGVGLPVRSRALWPLLASMTVIFFSWMILSGRTRGSDRLAWAMVANLVWLGGAAATAVWAHRRPSLLASSVYYTILFSGLFSVGFPLAISPATLQ